MSRLTDHLIDRHLHRMGTRAHHLDAMARYQFEWVRQALTLIESVMTDEDVPTETRERVLRGIVYGAFPSDAEVKLRHDLLEHVEVPGFGRYFFEPDATGDTPGGALLVREGSAPGEQVP